MPQKLAGMKIMAGNIEKDAAEIAGRSTRTSTSISWLVPRVFSLSNMAPESFFWGGGGEVFCFERESHLKALHFISTKKVCFYAKGSFPRRRHISTAEVYFYGEGTSLQRMHISTAEVYFYAEVYLYEESVFL